jgi:hypothetical protein
MFSNSSATRIVPIVWMASAEEKVPSYTLLSTGK